MGAQKEAQEPRAVHGERQCSLGPKAAWSREPGIPVVAKAETGVQRVTAKKGHRARAWGSLVGSERLELKSLPLGASWLVAAMRRPQAGQDLGAQEGHEPTRALRLTDLGCKIPHGRPQDGDGGP